VLVRWHIARLILDIAEMWYRYLGRVPHHIKRLSAHYLKEIMSLMLAEVEQYVK
jgi:hypothetical protein